jgi:molybdopterin-containing oxidoreductase family membrane subunit
MSTDASILAAAPTVAPNVTAKDIDDAVYSPLEEFPTRLWWTCIAITSLMSLVFVVSLANTVLFGIGTWGNNMPVAWGWALVNFVFWVGIGHAGTLISAILFLFRQRWRTGIARFAEAMTIFAVFCAMQFPLFHTGRPWLAMFWLIPYPNGQDIYQNYRSPLEWDVFAVGTYGLISLLFWYTGLVPDLASARDRATSGIRKFFYGILSLGWNGSNRCWSHYEKAYLLFAGLATPLVISVHSIVSFDFAVSIIPGWHTTIFPPYFVIGAVFSGFGMVATLILILRKMFKLERLITMDSIELMNKVVIATSLLVGFAYLSELFIAWYSGVIYERYVFMNRAFGFYAYGYWTMVICNVLVPQLFWFKPIRSNMWLMYPIVILVNVGMWFERFVIIITSLHRDFLPSNWDYYFPSWTEVGLFFGSFGIFLTCMLLFCRFFPTIATSEMKALLDNAQPHHHPQGAHHG